MDPAWRTGDVFDGGESLVARNSLSFMHNFFDTWRASSVTDPICGAAASRPIIDLSPGILQSLIEVPQEDGVIPKFETSNLSRVVRTAEPDWSF